MSEWNGYLKKIAGDMPPFLEQDRPAKVKEIYSSLKRDHPDMPAEMKARIAARKGKKSPQSRKSPADGGPKYKGPITPWHEKKAGLEEVLEQAPRYAHLLDDIAMVAARLGSHKTESLKSPTSETKQASLDQALGVLYGAYGPTLQKHAAADFYASLDRAQLAREALGVSFCKLAQASQTNPWKMASQVVRSYPSLVKVATGCPSPAQELASFYLAWGDEMEKKSNLLTTGISNLASKAKAVGGALLGQKGALRSAKHLAEQGVLKSEVPGVAKQVGQALKKQQTLQQMGGGSIARGQQLHAQNAAERAAKFGPKGVPAQPQTAAPIPTGPTTGQMLTGAGILGAGGLGAGYMMSGDEQPQPAY